MAKGVLSERSRNLIKVLLSDEKIRQKVYEDTKEFEKYKICTICSNGTIVLGKTRWRFWNRLLNCQDELPFESFALRVWDALVDLSSGFNNTAILEGLSREIVLSSVREREYDYVIDRLFDAARHICQDGSLAVEPSSAEDQRKSGSRVNTVPENIVININGEKKVLHFKDAIGDPFIDVKMKPDVAIRVTNNN